MASGVLRSIGTLSYSGQGWGLCDYRGSLIMSNGSATLVERDPATFEVTRQFTVRMCGNLDMTCRLSIPTRQPPVFSMLMPMPIGCQLV